MGVAEIVDDVDVLVDEVLVDEVLEAEMLVAEVLVDDVCDVVEDAVALAFCL